jgi:hypothetical protein
MAASGSYLAVSRQFLVTAVSVPPAMPEIYSYRVQYDGAWLCVSR